MTSDWRSTIANADSYISQINMAIEHLTRYRDEATARIAEYLRALSNLRRTA